MRTIAQTAVDNEKYFGDLDAVVGDGDFGYSMARGFENVLADWDGIDRTDIGTFLKKIAVIITGRIGGHLRADLGHGVPAGRQPLGRQDEADADDVIAMLRAATEGIKMRGQSDVGDKTLLDALVPATDALEAALAAGREPAARSRRLPRPRPGRRPRRPRTMSREARPGRLHRRAEHRLASTPARCAVAVMLEQHRRQAVADRR